MRRKRAQRLVPEMPEAFEPGRLIPPVLEAAAMGHRGRSQAELAAAVQIGSKGCDAMEGSGRMGTAHAHAWEPASELGMGRYRCACGQIAYRKFGGAIAPYARKHGPPHLRGDQRDWDDFYGRTSPLPSLDYYDRTPRG